jgi:GNAT superfamily N-acetyltransferase
MTRPATLDDLPAIVDLKLQMFEEAGMAEMLADDVYELVLSRYHALYECGIAQHFVVEQEGRIIACTGAFLKEDLPYCFYRRPVYGFIGDVYTLPEYRRRGYARQLATDAVYWLKSHGVEMIRLLTTPQARSLYTSLGFQPGDEMVLKLG